MLSGPFGWKPGLMSPPASCHPFRLSFARVGDGWLGTAREDQIATSVIATKARVKRFIDHSAQVRHVYVSRLT